MKKDVELNMERQIAKGQDKFYQRRKTNYRNRKAQIATEGYFRGQSRS